MPIQYGYFSGLCPSFNSKNEATTFPKLSFLPLGATDGSNPNPWTQQNIFSDVSNLIIADKNRAAKPQYSRCKIASYLKVG
jgi:hypothetical protein